MEALRNYESNDSVQNNPEKQKEAIRQETDRLFSILESPDITVDDLNSLVDKFSSNNPIFQTELINFQDYNSSRLEGMLRANMIIEQCDIDDPLDYFWVRWEFEWLSNELDSIWLDLWTLLWDYKNSLENNLDWLDQESIEKIKLSIINRLKQVSEIITDLKSDEIDKYWNLNRFSENRWIINEKVWEHLSFINSELLPSLEAYIKFKWWSEMPKKFQNRFDTSAWATDSFVPQNINYINSEYHIWEIEELLQAHVDEEWNFDEWFFSTQRLFDTSNPKHAEMLSSLWINSQEVNLLNEKDKKIEQEAILYFMAMIWVQIWVETLGWVVGTVVWWWVDVYDAFSSEEELLNIAKSLWLAEKEFRMDKTWVDNVLAWLWLIPWVTQIVKWSRLAKFMESVDLKAFENATRKIKEAMWLKTEKVSDVNEKIKSLEISKKDIESIPWFEKLFDSTKWDTIKDSITKEELLTLIDNNEALENIVNLYREKNWKIVDPDAFREFFQDYKGVNSADFDNIVWKLSKIYYKLLLFELEWSLNKALRLIWWAPWSWKSTSIKHIDWWKNDEYGATFDSTLNNTKFVDYLIAEWEKVWVEKVDIDFIHRNPELAWEWIVSRAIESWRPVELWYFINTYENVIKVMNELDTRTNINLRLIENSWSLDDIKQVSLDDINQLSSKGIKKKKLTNMTNKIIDKKIDSIIMDSSLSVEEQESWVKLLEKLKEQLLK